MSKTSRHLTSKLIKNFHENHTMETEQEFMKKHWMKCCWLYGMSQICWAHISFKQSN